jgi:transcriptional regulator with XRE-family HTH domain
MCSHVTMTAFQGLPDFFEGESMSDYGEGEERFVTIGERLRRAREARAMSLDDVASQTRIPMRHLQHIEQEEWDALPAPTYAVGFTRNYANAVGLDGPAIANELRDQIGGPRRRAPAPEYYEPADPARVPPKSLVLIVIIAAVLLIGAYLLWRNTLGADPGPAPEQTVEVPEATNAPDNGQAPAPADLTGQTVTLTALDGVWLRITDGENGPSLFTGILNSGQTFTVPATAARPVLRTGRPQMLRASAGGRDLGLIGPEERTVTNVSLLPQDLAARAAGQAPAGAAPPPAGAPAAAAPLRPRPAPARTPAPVPAPVQTQPTAPQPEAPASVPPPQR